MVALSLTNRRDRELEGGEKGGDKKKWHILGRDQNIQYHGRIKEQGKFRELYLTISYISLKKVVDEPSISVPSELG